MCIKFGQNNKRMVIARLKRRNTISDLETLCLTPGTEQPGSGVPSASKCQLWDRMALGYGWYIQTDCRLPRQHGTGPTLRMLWWRKSNCATPPDRQWQEAAHSTSLVLDMRPKTPECNVWNQAAEIDGVAHRYVYVHNPHPCIHFVCVVEYAKDWTCD